MGGTTSNDEGVGVAFVASLAARLIADAPLGMLWRRHS